MDGAAPPAAAPAPAPDAPVRRAPGDFVRGVVGRPVVVRLASGADYRGVLVCLDGYMNVALEQAEEYVDGVLHGKLGDCFLRGNNGARGARGARRAACGVRAASP
jgi:U6 snRNA-associated Sm-like protein LSm6